MSGSAAVAKRRMGEDVQVRNESNGDAPPTNKKKKETNATVDTDLLNCTICFHPLRPPLFQCKNGHVACSSCCDEHHDRCPTCKLSLKHSRCIALEKLVESIEVECSNDGCSKKFSYAGLKKHKKDTCTRARCFCPIQDCSFSGAIDLLSAHVDNCHKDAVKHLKSNTLAPVRIERNNPLYVIRLDNCNELLFLLANEEGSSGNALSMTCLCPETSEYSLEYELTHYCFGKGMHLSMKSPMKTGLKKWTGSSYPKDFFLLVPRKSDAVGSMTLDIKIRKNPVPSAANAFFTTSLDVLL